jgi:hypothetical protein
MTSQAFRPEPIAGPAAYKSYSILAPVSTHFRKATCAEVECPDYLYGWRIRADVLDEQMVHAATHSGRKFQWVRPSELENWIVYESGQPCFRSEEHRTRVDRPELYVVRDGDHRGNPRGTPARKHSSASAWQEDFAEHLDVINTEIERG